MLKIDVSDNVCRICFTASHGNSRKLPTLTPLTKSEYIESTRERKCKVCKQKWISVNVAGLKRNDSYINWAIVRKRPTIPPTSMYGLCKQVKTLQGCRRQEGCRYAHSDIELKYWTKERTEKEPRPAPSIIMANHHLCKFMLNTLQCPVGPNCLYAHSSNELHKWMEVPPEKKTPRPPPELPPELYQPCRHVFAGRRCPAGLKCKFAHSREELDEWLKPKIRDRPVLNFQIGEYKLCKYIANRLRCVHGVGCTFAHSEHELLEWNRLLRSGSFEQGDFAFQVREKIFSDYKQSSEENIQVC